MPFVEILALKQRLTVEPDVRLAVLYGSRARGDDRAGSDVDLLMVIRKDSIFRQMDLERLLESELDLPVQIVALESVRRAPTFLADVIEDGQVLVDRDRAWPELLADYPSIARAAAVADAELRVRAQAAIAELTADCQ